MRRADWKTSPISEIYEGLYDGPHATPKPSESGPVFLGIKNITDDGYLDLSVIRHIAEEDFPKWTRRVEPCPGDIVFSYEATLNLYAMIPDGFRGCLGRRMALIRPNPSKIDGRFLLYCFFTKGWRTIISNNMLSGSTVDRIPLTKFPTFPINYPSLPTQKQIAGILSSYDDLIENNLRRIKILEEMAQSLYREWFVDFRFPAYADPSSEADSMRKMEASAGRPGHEKVPLVDSPLGKIPKGWEVKKLFEIAENFDSQRKPISKMQRAQMKGEYPYYGAAKVIDYVNDFIFDGEYLLMAEDGSVITTDRAPVLQLVNGKFWPNNHTHILRGKAFVSTHYLYLRLSIMDISPYITGAAQPKITQENMNRIPFVVGTADLHRNFDHLISSQIYQINALKRQISNLRRTRDLLLPKMISGELDVSRLDVAGLNGQVALR